MRVLDAREVAVFTGPLEFILNAIQEVCELFEFAIKTNYISEPSIPPTLTPSNSLMYPPQLQMPNSNIHVPSSTFQMQAPVSNSFIQKVPLQNSPEQV